MKTLDQFNRERSAEWTRDSNLDSKSPPNGIECPVCKSELVDSDKDVILTSTPPRKHIRCPQCSFVGIRIA